MPQININHDRSSNYVGRRSKKPPSKLPVIDLVVGLAGGFLLSLYSGDWHPYCVFLGLLGGFAALLCAWAALIWSVGRLSIKLWSVLKKLSQK